VGKEIDSSALLAVNRILGIAGSRTGSQRTELEDGQLVQVLDTNPIIRRSRSLPGTSGIFMAVMENNHGAGATAEESDLDPFTPGALSFAPYPSPVPEGFDFWIASAHVRHVSGTASNFTNAALRFATTAAMMVLGVDEAGAAITRVGRNIPVAIWDTIEGGSVGAGVRENGEVWLRMGLRVRPGMRLLFDSAATNAVVVELILLCSLVPSALGQDILS